VSRDHLAFHVRKTNEAGELFLGFVQ